MNSKHATVDTDLARMKIMSFLSGNNTAILDCSACQGFRLPETHTLFMLHAHELTFVYVLRKY